MHWLWWWPCLEGGKKKYTAFFEYLLLHSLTLAADAMFCDALSHETSAGIPTSYILIK